LVLQERYIKPQPLFLQDISKNACYNISSIKNYWQILYYYFSDKKMYFSFSFFQLYYFFFTFHLKKIFISMFFSL